MLSGATCRALAIVGTAVFRIVVSSDSMKNATATSHGTSHLPELLNGTEVDEAAMGLTSPSWLATARQVE